MAKDNRMAPIYFNEWLPMDLPLLPLFLLCAAGIDRAKTFGIEGRRHKFAGQSNFIWGGVVVVRKGGTWRSACFECGKLGFRLAAPGKPAAQALRITASAFACIGTIVL
ncbi:hypothetical protein [Burkholderia sp. 3C]